MATSNNTISILIAAEAADALSKIDQLKVKLGGVGDEAAGSKAGVDGLSGAIGGLSAQGQDKLTALNAKVGGVGDEAAGASPKVGGLKNEVDDLGDSGSNKIGVLIDTFKALAAAAAVKEFIDANVQAEAFEKTMVLLTGSTAGAAAEFDYIKGLANKLGLELFSTATAYSSLSAATKGTSLEGQATREIFEAVASSMSALGKSSADTEGALLAVGQMVSKGTVSMEELRGQLGERLPGAFQVAANAMGTTTTGLIEMVSKGDLAADVFLPKFAAALKNAYGGVNEVNTFQAAWNRLQNAIQETFIVLGESGVMDVATKSLDAVGFVISKVGTLAATAKLGYEGLWYAATGKDAELARTREGLEKTGSALFGITQQTESAGDEFERLFITITTRGGSIAEDFGQKIVNALIKLDGSIKSTDAAFKNLGIDRSLIETGISEVERKVIESFKTMASDPNVKGDSLLAGLLVALGQVSKQAIPEIGFAYKTAGNVGRQTTEELAAGVNALKTKQNGLWESVVDGSKKTKDLADAQKKQAEETKKATEAAQKYEIELLKIASNEKIKVIESRIKLDIAEVEANAKIATAIIESISQTYSADVGLIGDLMSQITDGYSFADRTRLTLITASNQRVDELHQAQMSLIGAQIDYMRAKTDATSSGNPLVTIQADGLKPHLEAFMWEILGAIQVRMAYDGGDMLTGGCSL